MTGTELAGWRCRLTGTYDASCEGSTREIVVAVSCGHSASGLEVLCQRTIYVKVTHAI